MKQLPLNPATPPLQATQPQTLPAQPAPQLPTLPHDIHAAIPLPQPISWWPWLVAAALLLVAGGLFLYFRRRGSGRESLQQRFLRRLDDLRSLQKSNPMRWAEKANQLLRRYLEARFSLPVTRQTTEEFLHAPQLAKLPALREFQQELQQCLTLADLTKFARHCPGDREMQEMERAIRAFIQRSQNGATEQQGEQL